MVAGRHALGEPALARQILEELDEARMIISCQCMFVGGGNALALSMFIVVVAILVPGILLSPLLFGRWDFSAISLGDLRHEPFAAFVACFVGYTSHFCSSDDR